MRLGEKKLRNMMEQPVQCKSIQTERNAKDSVVTIVNWGVHQEEACEEINDLGPTEELMADRMTEGIGALRTVKKASQRPTKGQPTASKGPTKGQQKASQRPTKGHKQECKEC